MRRLRDAGLIALIFLALDVAAAQVLKRTLPVWRFQERGVLERKYRVRSDLFHHDLSKNVNVSAVWGNITYRYTTNSLGFRDAVVRDIPLHSETPRLLFLGDSFTEGLGLPFDSTFVGIVATRLRSRGIDVLNAAVAGYSPAMYYRKTKYLLDELKLRVNGIVVFIDISDIINEARQYVLDSAQDRVLAQPVPNAPRASRVKRLLKDNSVLIHVIDALKDVVGNRKRYALDEEAALWTVDDGHFQRYGREGLRRARQNMNRLLAVAHRHGAALTVAVYPWPDQIVRRDLNSRQVQFWKAWAAANGVAFIDFFPEFITGDDGRETVRRYFIPYDYHWNAAGHARIAQGLLRTDLVARLEESTGGVQMAGGS